MSVKYVIAWEFSGLRKHVILSDELFIGRLPARLSSLNHSYTPFKVYIYYPLIRKAFHTGINSSVVSRLHAKLVLRGGEALITDYGPEGRGSRNGLIVNESLIPKASTARLVPGSTFRLGASGPLFTLLAETPLGHEVRLDEGVPSVMPESLARDLSGEGLRIIGLGRGEALVIALRKGVVRSGKYLIRVEGLGEGERVLKNLLRIQCRVSEAIELMVRGRFNDALDALKPLNLNVFRESINSLGDEVLKEEFEWVLRLVNEGLTDESILLSRLRRLRSLIEEAASSI